MAKYTAMIANGGKNLDVTIIKSINNQSTCWGLCSIENEGIFISGGWMHDLRVYRYDNYECIDIIKDAHLSHITGFIEFKNDLIGLYSSDAKIII